MITDLKPYPAMKESGVEWLGEVPEHWSLRRTKTILRQRSQKGYPNEPLLAATQTKGVVRKEQYENRTVLALKDLHLLKLVCVGDLVISLRSFQGGIEYAREQGIISPAYTVLYPNNPDIHGYLACLFKSKPYIENLTLYVTGIRQGQNIDYEKLSRSELPLPLPLEQAAIVRYLDHVGRRVRRFVQAKQKLIRLLEEQKQAIIHRAVTRGLDLNVPFKDSGVEWLGEVPEHWEVVKLRHFARVGNGSTPSRSRMDYWSSGHYAWLNSSVANRVRVDEADQFVTDVALKECHLPRLVPGDVLIAITGQGKTRGKSTVLAIEATINQHLSYVHLQFNRMLPEYLQLVFTGAYAHLRSISDDSGSTKGALICADIRHFKVPMPLPVEQRNILNWVQQENETSDLTVEATRREIDLLNEYRTRLIADVVTGKLDVREAAAQLPAEDERREPVKEMDVEDNPELLAALEG